MTTVERVPIILDVDTGVDDALALALAVMAPRAELVAVTTVAGNVDLTRATANTFAVLPGHDDPRTEKIVDGDVIHKNDRFTIVKKRPENRADTEATNPRA